MEASINIAGSFLVFAFAALGSALGIGSAAKVAAACAKKRIKEGGKPVMSWMIFVGAPMSQLFYGMIMLILLLGKNYPADMWIKLLPLEIGFGLAIGASAWMQGLVGALCCDALNENDGKGLTFYIMLIGVVESTALLAFILGYVFLPAVG